MSCEDDWPQTPVTPSAMTAGACVWRLHLHAAPPTEKYQSLLSEDETLRAQRYTHANKHREFVVGRGTLRLILGTLLQSDPNDLVFTYDRHAKPLLARPAPKSPVHFNLAHSHGMILVAASHQRIGIDVEHLRPRDRLMDLARRFFSPGEVEALTALPTHEQPLAFFACWVRKEAFVKAHGDGIGYGLDRFDVSVNPAQPAELLATRPDPAEATRWTLRDLPVGSTHIGTLAVEGALAALHLASAPTP